MMCLPANFKIPRLQLPKSKMKPTLPQSYFGTFGSVDSGDWWAVAFENFQLPKQPMLSVMTGICLFVNQAF